MRGGEGPLRPRTESRRPRSLTAVHAVAVGCLCSLSLLFASAAQAAPGDLDPSFSADGRETTDLGPGPGQAQAVARQADGKIVTAGTSADDFALARYNPDGSLDTTFSDDGKLTTDFGSRDEANAVAVQNDGKIVAAGNADESNDFALARYNADGSLDTTFSGDGKVTTDFGSSGAARAVSVQGDGKIVAAGERPSRPQILACSGRILLSSATTPKTVSVLMPPIRLLTTSCSMAANWYGATTSEIKAGRSWQPHTSHYERRT